MTKKTLAISIALLAISLYGCKKDEKAETKKGGEKANPCAGKTAENPCAGKAAENPCAGKNPCNPGAGKATAMAHMPADKNADMIVAKISHAKPKPSDPVHVVWDKITVKSVDFKDAANLVGATAELEIDIGSLKSGSTERDKHLRAPDFFDVAKMATASVKISDVVKDGDAYKAQAEITLVGVTQKWEVGFKVLEAKDDWVRVQGWHKFNRSEFKLGVGAKGPADEVDLMLQLTLKKS